MSESREQQFFVGGFSLGLLAGVVGYYFFGTKQGKQVRQELEREWLEAQDYLVEKGALSEQATSQPQTFSQFFQAITKQVLSALDLDWQELVGQEQTASQSRQDKAKRSQDKAKINKNKKGKRRRLPQKKNEPKKFFGV